MNKRSVFFDTSLIYFIVIVIFVGIRIFAGLVNVSNSVAEGLNAFIQIGAMFLIPFFLYKFLRKKKTLEIVKDFNIKPISIKAILIAFLIGFVIYFANLAVASFFNIFIFGTGYDPSFGMSSATEEGYTTIQFLLDILTTAVLPGICEEFCHRGMLLNGYKSLGIKKSIILVGVLFGLMHLNIEQFFYASVIGMFLTFLVYVSGSIIPSIIVHFMNNAMGLYMSFASKNNLPFGDFATNLKTALSGNFLSVIFTILVIVIVLVALIIALVYLLIKNTRVKEMQGLAQKAIKRKQREEILSMLDLNVNDLNKEQGIQKDINEPEVEFTKVNGKSMINFTFPKTPLLFGIEKSEKPTIKDKMFLYATMFIGVFITISTLIWGLL